MRQRSAATVGGARRDGDRLGVMGAGDDVFALRSNMTSPKGVCSPVDGLRVNRHRYPSSGRGRRRPSPGRSQPCPARRGCPRPRGRPARERCSRTGTPPRRRHAAAPRSTGTSPVPTMAVYIAVKRARQSLAKRSSPVAAANPPAVCSFRPRLRIVSIIPGMDTGAPERTLTSKRVGRVPETPAHALLDLLEVTADLFVQAVRPARCQIGAAGLGADDEARRHRQTQIRGHHAEVRRLAADQLDDLGGGSSWRWARSNTSGIGTLSRSVHARRTRVRRYAVIVGDVSPIIDDLPWHSVRRVSMRRSARAANRHRPGLWPVVATGSPLRLD